VVGRDAPVVLVVFAQGKFRKITKRTHFGFSNPPINTGDFQPSAQSAEKNEPILENRDTTRTSHSTRVARQKYPCNGK
jgi:hypothetical protein